MATTTTTVPLKTKLAAMDKLVLKRNKKFADASKAEQRVMIAKDVIAAIKASKYSAEQGTWVDILDYNATKFEEGKELQAVIKDPAFSCNVCAIGACFTSAVKLGDNCKINEDMTLDRGVDIGNRGFDKDPVIRRYFTPAQVSLIECAFELGGGWAGNTSDAAAAFGEKYDYDDDRLVAIMENIVKNNGTFRP